MGRGLALVRDLVVCVFPYGVEMYGGEEWYPRAGPTPPRDCRPAHSCCETLSSRTPARRPQVSSGQAAEEQRRPTVRAGRGRVPVGLGQQVLRHDDQHDGEAREAEDDGAVPPPPRRDLEPPLAGRPCDLGRGDARDPPLARSEVEPPLAGRLGGFRRRRRQVCCCCWAPPLPRRDVEPFFAGRFCGFERGPPGLPAVYWVCHAPPCHHVEPPFAGRLSRFRLAVCWVLPPPGYQAEPPFVGRVCWVAPSPPRQPPFAERLCCSRRGVRPPPGLDVEPTLFGGLCFFCWGWEGIHWCGMA